MYYKILDPSFLHRGFQYVIGENTKNSVGNNIQKKDSGFYICEKKHIGKWLKLHHNPIICEVVILEDSIRYPMKYSLKVDHILLVNPLPIREFLRLHKECIDIFVKQDGLNIEYVDHPSYATSLMAVKQNGRALQFLDSPSYELCFEAVRQNGRALQYVKHQSFILCLAAVKQNGLALQYIHNKIPLFCYTALYQNGLALRYIKKQNRALCRIAILQNGLAFQHVIEKSQELYDIAILQNPLAKIYNKKNFTTINQAHTDTKVAGAQPTFHLG